MSWTCQCTSTNADDARFCTQCGQPFELARKLEPAAAPEQPGAVQRAKSSTGNVWKLGAIGGVIFVGAIFGSLVAVSVFGGGGTAGTAQTSRNPDTKSAFQQAFDASFKSSCRQSAMRAGHVSQTAADSYCDCALSVFNQTHSMAKAVASCKQYVVR
jgi:hypothetical protein